MPVPDAEAQEYLRRYYQSLSDRPLFPETGSYVHLYDPKNGLVHDDPIGQLVTTIDWTEPDSVQLFSGFRGTGKTTELRRLRHRLEQLGFIVALCDMEDYFNLTTPIDISDFLVTVAAAFGDQLVDDNLLPRNPAHEGYWTRFWEFLKSTNVSLEGVELHLGTEGIRGALKASLKQDPSFRQNLQRTMRGHLGRLVQDVRSYVSSVLKELKDRHGAGVRVVLILDSIEKIRGTSVNAREVEDSLDMLFAGHAEKLRFDFLHVVYTAPPWLKIRTPGVEGLYSGGVLLPCVKVRDEKGEAYRPGLDGMASVAEKRGDWKRVLGSRAILDQLSLATGGYLRDFLRLLQHCCFLASQSGLPLSPERISYAIDELRNDYMPIAHADAAWLDRVRRTHQAELASTEHLSNLSRFFDTHLVLCYRNGREWYGVHPIVSEQVADQVRSSAPPPTPVGRS